MTSTGQLPDISKALAPVLAKVPVDQQPLLIAYAERQAAERYRRWAGTATQAAHKALLLICADREDEIARRIESLYPNAASVQHNLVARTPELAELTQMLFAPLSIEDQFVLQARGERIGAATWRAFAQRASSPYARDVFLSCAVLEEESAAFLESMR